MHNVLWFNWFPVLGDGIEVDYFYDTDFEEDSLTMYEMQDGDVMDFSHDDFEHLCIFETVMENAYNEIRDPFYK